MPVFKISSRSSKVNSCSLNIEDFKALYRELNDKVNEALEIELTQSPAFENIPAGQARVLRDRIRQNFKLSVLIVGTKEEILSGDDASVFDNENLPNNINTITFDSSYYFKIVIGQEPMNKLFVQFDFKKQKLFDFSNPVTEPIENESSISVTGMNDTWVNGVYSSIKDFLENKKKNRNWLHKKHFYDLFLYVLFYPIAFWCIYRVTSLLPEKINIVLLIAICLYLFIFLLFILRILFNYTRWIFPLLEFVPTSGTKMGRHRATLYILALGIISATIRDIIKSLF